MAHYYGDDKGKTGESGRRRRVPNPNAAWDRHEVMDFLGIDRSFPPSPLRVNSKKIATRLRIRATSDE